MSSAALVISPLRVQEEKFICLLACNIEQLGSDIREGGVVLHETICSRYPLKCFKHWHAG